MSDDHNAIQNKLQSAVDGMMKAINVRKVRPLQRQAYLNMAKCFDSDGSDQVVDNCVERESYGVKVAQQVIQQEMGQFQNRVQRCVQDCEDSTRDSLGSADMSDPRTQEKAQNMMTKCTAVCVDKHVAMLKSIQGRIESEIDSKAARR
jgi:hypothetical protein